MESATLLMLLAVLASGVYQNIDNLALAAAYRFNNIVISWPANLFIGVLSGIASGIAVALGCLLADAARQYVGEALEKVGCGILIMIGIWILVGYFRARLFPQLAEVRAGKQPEMAARDQPTPMRRGEMLVVAVAISVDNLAPSFIGGLSGMLGRQAVLAGVLLALVTGLWSLAAVAKGQALGRKGRLHLRFLAPELVSGCMILGIALLGLMEDVNPLNPERWFAAPPARAERPSVDGR